MKGRLSLASLLAGSLLIASFPLPGRAAEGDPPPYVVATRRMTIVASSLSYTRLHIPRPSRISLNYYGTSDLPTPRFDEGPGFGAVVLYSKRQVSFSAVRLPASKGVLQRLVSLAPKICQLDDYCEVPAGDYFLFAITEVPMSVRLELRGLTGKSTVKLHRPVLGDVSEATASYFHSTPQGSIEAAAHGAGFSPTLDRESHYLFSAFWFRGPQEDAGPPPADAPLLQVGNAGSCMYSGSPPADAYAPGCPGGEQNYHGTSARVFSDFAYLEWGSITNLGPGQYGRGHYAVHTGIRHPGFVGFWFDLAAM